MRKIHIGRLSWLTVLGALALGFGITSANACIFISGESEESVLVCPGEGMMGKPELIDDVLDDAAEHALGLGGGGGGVGIAPAFAVFASGQFARVGHDGFDVSGPFFEGPGPSFTADDFSIIGSLDFNAAKHFGFEDRYGLNLGLFGGYTSTDVSFDRFLGMDVGSAVNRAGMFGTYGLFRQGVNYVLVSATTFIGETDVENETFGTSNNYDTAGYAGTLSAGRIFVLAEGLHFDLRGGIVGVIFKGDGYSDGFSDIGESKISFGALKFEPGVYLVRPLDNGMVLSPYTRLELQHQFGYRNTGSIDGFEFELDDADFSASLSAGLNLKVSASTTVSAELRGKASGDSTTLAGKFGVKVAF